MVDSSWTSRFTVSKFDSLESLNWCKVVPLETSTQLLRLLAKFKIRFNHWLCLRNANVQKPVNILTLSLYCLEFLFVALVFALFMTSFSRQTLRICRCLYSLCTTLYIAWHWKGKNKRIFCFHSSYVLWETAEIVKKTITETGKSNVRIQEITIHDNPPENR